MKKNKKLWLQLLKLVGIGIFIQIILNINHTRLFEEIKKADVLLLGISFLMMLILIFIKSIRWHIIVKKAGLNPNIRDSWKLYNIGLALAVITPAKLGEFGKAVYLTKDGMNGITAIGINVIDRLSDTIITYILIVLSIWFLFGFIIVIYTISISILFLLIIILLNKQTNLFRLIKKYFSFVSHIITPSLVTKALLITIISWIIYFAWAILLAKSIGINVPAIPLIAILTISGTISILPIAPSGLGTRDVALITLLAPFGIPSEQAVAMALLMFASIVLSSLYGMFLWMKSSLLHKT